MEMPGHTLSFWFYTLLGMLGHPTCTGVRLQVWACASSSCPALAGSRVRGTLRPRAWQVASPPFWRMSHTKSHQVPHAQRERSLNRPSDNFTASTGLKKPSHFLLSPSCPSQSDASYRNPEYGHWRAKLKNAKTPKKLLKLLDAAVSAGQVDSSVLGAAMQTCGSQQWWKPLLRVHAVQEALGVQLHEIYKLIFLNSLACCLKQRKGHEHELRDRKAQAFKLGKQVWESLLPPSTDSDFNSAICSAWKLCVAIGSPAFSWGVDILDWSQTQRFSQNIISRSTLLAMYEQNGQQEQVNLMLKQTVLQNNLVPNEVMLGQLINVPAESWDWKRVEELWQMLCKDFSVKPNLLCYRARIKAHFLAGRPAFVLTIIDEMEVAGIPQDAWRTAELHLQALMIVYHANLGTCTKGQLESFLRKAIDFDGASLEVRKKTQQLLRLAERLVHDPCSLRFLDLLVHDNCKNGIMNGWLNNRAGKKYLKEDTVSL